MLHLRRQHLSDRWWRLVTSQAIIKPYQSILSSWSGSKCHVLVMCVPAYILIACLFKLTKILTMSTISFSLRAVPRFTDESPVGYYAVVANPGKFTPEQLYETVQSRCTVTSTDIVAVMDALVNVIAEKLSCGTKVEIPGLGYFSPVISCHRKIADRNDKKVARDLYVGNIAFRPKAGLQKKLADVRFERSSLSPHTFFALTDLEILKRVCNFLNVEPVRFLDRAVFESLTGYRRTKAQKTLKRLTEEGLLQKQGHISAPYYILTEKGMDSLEKQSAK